ncbi:type II toxin-antitoxin system YafQ family toxin [Candidatus Kaiserbacteria bacterium]|nr:type II toxin-antitoxin system YafQ family toxin [Candidatus Kaiserbacteria bacterium]
MRRVVREPQFDSDIKRLKRRHKDMDKLLTTVAILRRDGRLPVQFRPHKLSGDYDGQWECHIESDWLLTYEIYEDAVTLARTGSHSDLFG